MRNADEMLKIIKQIAEDDPNISAAVLNGSRADPKRPKDIYQDYDVVYLVRDVKPYYNNLPLIEKLFGEILICQLPDLNDYPDMTADKATRFVYLMIFKDGVRVDLTVTSEIDDRVKEPMTVLLDKTGTLSDNPSDESFLINRPTQTEFDCCCNQFWWCLNNVAKGLAREEMPYVKSMIERVERPMLDRMIEWYIGSITDFSVSAGKFGKYYKKYLPDSIYSRYLKTFSTADIHKTWASVTQMCKLFSDIAKVTAKELGLIYNLSEENGARIYLENVRQGAYRAD